MKKIFVSIFALSMFTSLTLAADFSVVLDRMYTHGLTKYNTQAEFRGSDPITRGASAKFIDQYAQYMQLDKTYTACEFSDIGDYDSTLVPHILEACAYGLLKGSDGKFMPTNNITEAQGITMVMRSLYGFQDETGTPWYSEYYALGTQAGIIKDEDMDSLAGKILTREKLGSWFYAAAHLGESDSPKKTTEQEKIDDATAQAIAIEQGTQKAPKTNTVAGPNGYTVYSEAKVEQALAAGNRVYLYFHADRCPSCRALDSNLSAEDNFPKDLIVFKVDYDNATTLKTTYGISQQHTLIKIDKNKTETHRSTTANDLNDIMEVGGSPRI